MFTYASILARSPLLSFRLVGSPISFSGVAPVPKFTSPLSFSVFQPPPSADLTRLADDTSGGHKEVSRLIGRGF